MVVVNQKKIEKLYAQLLQELGANTEPKFLDVANTPKRVAKMLATELLKGYQLTEGDLLAQMRLFRTNKFPELVVQAGIPFSSLCAHHVLPFSGTAAIGYLPGPYIIGLSKMTRIIDFYAARLQIQERLGAQVVEFLHTHVKATASFVLLKAEHGCMSCRGVKRTHVPTLTLSTRPLPPEASLIAQFQALVAHASL